eukprot:TRINITY_DN904_c0_g6_i1.p1 TRINITY_DN904_c0_g6~~TRINITY_DN904_c0_g6_i1.p1  ORF type:complete len:193 (+),score=97.17 TRINITY_DN904_c0_g6_i1:102-680(+)
MATDKSKGVDTSFRRTWSDSNYLNQETEEVQPKRIVRDPNLPRAPLKARENSINFHLKLNKKTVLTPSSDASSHGYFCDVCECVVKDSANYLDHVNGRKHQRMLGMSMRTERADLKSVRERFEANKRKQLDTEQEIQQRLEKLQQAQQISKKKKLAKEIEQEQLATLAEESANDELVATGLPISFGSSKKKN